MSSAAFKLIESRPVRIAVAVVLAVLLCLAVIKTAAWWQVKRQVDAVIEAAAPFAAIEYDSIDSDLSGAGGAEGVRIKAHMFQDALNVDAVRVEAGGLFALLGLDDALAQGRLPGSVTLRFDGIALDLGADYLRPLDAARVNLLGLPFDQLGCGEVSHLGPEALRAMGISTLRADVRLAMHSDADGRMTVTATAAVADLYDVTFEQQYTGAVAGSRRWPAAPPALSRATLTYVDTGYNARRNAYCAKQLDVPVDTFLAEHAERLRGYAAERGLALSEEMLAGYREFMRGPGELYLVVAPAEPVGIVQLSQLTPNEALVRLAPSVSVNRRVIREIVATTSPKDPARGMTAAQLLAKYRHSNPNRHLPPEVLPPTAPREFRPAPLDRLGDYVGERVRLVTDDGRRLEGNIERVTQRWVKLRRHLKGGSVTMNLQRHAITGVELYR